MVSQGDALCRACFLSTVARIHAVCILATNIAALVSITVILFISLATLAGPVGVVDAVLVSAQQTLLFVLLPLLDPVNILALAVDDVLPARVHRAQVVRFVVNLR